MQRLTSPAVLSLLALAALASACSPAPRRNLTTEDKQADLLWLYSQFNENYAPLDYKEQRHGFKYEELKGQYMKDAATTKTNEDFYALMYRFVSSFKDAHTSASLANANLPGRAKVAYLGFTGKRVGDKLAVTELMPTVRDGQKFPVKVGDQLTKINGVALKDLVKRDLVQYRDLGQDESNYTYHFPRLLLRVTTANGLPAETSADLTVVRGGKETHVVLPWVVQDLFDFQKEQKAATKTAAADEGASPAKKKGDFTETFLFGYMRPDGQFEKLSSLFDRITRRPQVVGELADVGFNWTRTFEFVDLMPTWAVRLLDDPKSMSSAPLAGAELLSKDRKVPDNAFPITEAKTYPAYVTKEKVKGADGKENGKEKWVGYIYLNTFSPAGGADEVVAEFKATLEKFKQAGVKDVVIDLINNGGGSLVLGMKLAQALTKEKVVQPEIQFRISETWRDDFEQTARDGASPAEREFAKRAFDALNEDFNSGKRLSRKMTTELLAPFDFDTNEKADEKLNVVLLTNEMCASMCDIFTAILKDNGLAKVVGSKTMGAGGNVVSHFQAPNSHLTVNQTESLIVRKDGTYIENNGIEPDVAMNVSESTLDHYTAVRNKAMELILTEK
jgi:C-terminal processing protease CtpA/Prc